MSTSTAAWRGSWEITLSGFSHGMVHAVQHAQKSVVYVPCQGSVENAEDDVIGDALDLVR